MGTRPVEPRNFLRQAIDDEINTLEESLRALKSRRNALAPISCLPPETLFEIFSFLSPSANNEPFHLKWICVSHVCRQWRETALNHPRFWSHINFSMLAPAALDEILARAKMAPLRLEFTTWKQAQVDAFQSKLDAHISHTRHLRIYGPLQRVLERLVSSAPALESLSLSHRYDLSLSAQAVIPANLFNYTTPSLTSLGLNDCDISWKSPLFKGLQTLEIRRSSTEAGPKLEDWLDALNEMPQLETLILQYASPSAPVAASLISEPSRTVTLTSLTTFHISVSAKDCALALAHLVMPAVTSLHVDAKSYQADGEDVGPLISHAAQFVCGLQGTEPLRSILILGKRGQAKVHAWTMPDADLEECDLSTLSGASIPARLMFAAASSNWNPGVCNEIIGALFTLLPVDSVSTFTAHSPTRLGEEFWLTHAPRWPSLEQVHLAPTAVKGFRDMLAEDAPSDGPRLPSLTKLILVCVTLTAIRTYDLRDMLIERVEQGVPFDVLDLRTSFASHCAVQFLREVVVDVKEPLTVDLLAMEEPEGPEYFNLQREIARWIDVKSGGPQNPLYGPYSISRITYDDRDEDEDDESFVWAEWQVQPPHTYEAPPAFE